MNADEREIVLDVLYAELRNMERRVREAVANDDGDGDLALSQRYVSALSLHIDELEAE